MSQSLKHYASQTLQGLFSLKKANRIWHVPVLAALCIGIPLFTGLYFGRIQNGLLASLSGLVILYLPLGSGLKKRTVTILICSVGFMFSYAIGLLFSFNPFISALVFGIFSTLVHWINLKLQTKAPGNFFFIMLASISSCLPYAPELIPQKIALVAIGTLLACVLASIYSVLIQYKDKTKQESTPTRQVIKGKTVSLLESLIIGVFMFCSLWIGHVLHLKNPYWIPISCIAVMQGVTVIHVWQRVMHRILGTFVGLIVCWLILSFLKTPLSICISIVLLQFIVEMLIVRNYALAVIFITPMTLLLAEAANPLILYPNQLFSIRFYDILIGSMIGALGGWLVYNERLRHSALLRVKKTKSIFKKNNAR